jgi:hypothetical protein
MEPGGVVLHGQGPRPAALAMVVVVTVAACGGGPSRAKAEYLAAADAVCAGMNDRLESVGEPVSRDPAALAAVVEQSAAIVDDTFRRLRRLPAPDEERATLRRLFGHVDHLLVVARDLTMSLRAGRRHAVPRCGPGSSGQPPKPTASWWPTGYRLAAPERGLVAVYASRAVASRRSRL